MLRPVALLAALALAPSALADIPPPPGSSGATYVAFARSSAGEFGTAIGPLADRGRIDDDAVAACQAQGGADCGVWLGQQNGCIAFVTDGQGHDGLGWKEGTSDDTLTSAVQTAASACEEKGGQACMLQTSRCSFGP